jgi:hypothetical protein
MLRVILPYPVSVTLCLGSSSEQHGQPVPSPYVSKRVLSAELLPTVADSMEGGKSQGQIRIG